MAKSLKIAIIEPFYSGSHKTWVDDVVTYLPFEIHRYTLPGRHWKWRMAAGAIELANQLNVCDSIYDVIITTDMLDVPTFKSLLKPAHYESKVVLYMHENQIVFPYQTLEKEKTWDRHYGLINYKSILCADSVWFNSVFHKDIFYKELDTFLSVFPDQNFHRRQAKLTISKSMVVPLGINFEAIKQCEIPNSSRPTILWNHRWEYDKNPASFFKALFQLSEEGLAFDLIVAGESFSKRPKIFDEAKVLLDKHIIHWGFFKEKSDYHQALWRSTLLPVTSNQEFFGLSVMEAMFCRVKPILPNRLSYLDLYQGLNVFYDDEQEFYLILKKAIELNERADYQSEVEQYGWKFVADLYTESLLKVSA